jgi:hypothetical protein
MGNSGLIPGYGVVSRGNAIPSSGLGKALWTSSAPSRNGTLPKTRLELMIHKPGKTAIDKHLVELRREGIEALQCFNGTAERLDFYKKYLALSEYYNVRFAGPFLVIKGGKPADRPGVGSSDLQSLVEIE